ncbi:MAG TPA: ferritin [Phycisphaerales bacterium]|nr:ferritin [Phycisphaerales bacterium]
MLSKKMEAALNDQINAEAGSAYLYWSMAAYFHANNLSGFANWMTVQAKEEMVHADKFYQFIVDRGGTVQLKAIKAPEVEWASPLAAFKAAYKHEQYITGRINNLVDQAAAEKDHAAAAMLQWFVTEQVEEEKSADEIVQMLSMAGDAKGALFMIDRELGKRVFTPPAAAAD